MLLQTAGPQGTRRIENEKARFTLIFVAADEDHHGEGKPGQAEVELTYNWPPEDGRLVETYTGGRNFGHLAYRVKDIYETCARLQAGGVTDIWRLSARQTVSRSNCSSRSFGIQRHGAPVFTM